MKHITKLFPLLVLSSFSFLGCNKAVKSVSVMSFNILHGINFPHQESQKETIVNLDPIISIVKKYNPDIINFNEIYGKHTKFGNQVKYIADALNYNSYFVHAADITKDKNEYGGAILSRFEIIKSLTHAIPDAPSCTESRAIGEVELAIPNNGKLRVLESHFGLDSPEWKNAVTTLKPLVINQNRTLFMGDLNMDPSNNLIKEIEALMNEAVPTNLFTFDSLNPHEHIDYIFNSFDLSNNNGRVLNDAYSDHLAVMTTINL